MRIRYKRSGGIANIVREIEIDSNELPQNLQDLLKSLNSFERKEPLRSDDFFHELYLEDGRTILCTDSKCPPDLLTLFDSLTQRYRGTEKK